MTKTLQTDHATVTRADDHTTNGAGAGAGR
jgi:hypothetical protein